MKRWTKDEEELLIACVEYGWIYKDIGIELGRSFGSIQKKINNLGLISKRGKRKTTAEYKKDLLIKCPTMIVLEEYIHSEVKILHKCLICDIEYKCKPTDKLRGDSCKVCGQKKNKQNNGGGILPNNSGTLYLVYIFEYDLYKFGITSKTIKERMMDNRLSSNKYEIILERKFNKGSDAMLLEKEWSDNLKEYKVNTGLLRSGNTETFKELKCKYMK